METAPGKKMPRPWQKAGGGRQLSIANELLRESRYRLLFMCDISYVGRTRDVPHIKIRFLCQSFDANMVPLARLIESSLDQEENILMNRQKQIIPQITGTSLARPTRPLVARLNERANQYNWRLLTARVHHGHPSEQSLEYYELFVQTKDGQDGLFEPFPNEQLLFDQKTGPAEGQAAHARQLKVIGSLLLAISAHSQRDPDTRLAEIKIMTDTSDHRQTLMTSLCQ